MYETSVYDKTMTVPPGFCDLAYSQIQGFPTIVICGISALFAIELI